MTKKEVIMGNYCIDKFPVDILCREMLNKMRERKTNHVEAIITMKVRE